MRYREVAGKSRAFCRGNVADVEKRRGRPAAGQYFQWSGSLSGTMLALRTYVYTDYQER